MSTKRIVWISVIGVLFILTVIAVMLLTLFFRRENETAPLPEAVISVERPEVTAPDALDRVEVTKDTIQAVIATLSRPEVYSRDVVIKNFWDGGEATFNINTSVMGGLTALKTLTVSGLDKRIIITQDTVYIWYKGEWSPYTGKLDLQSDGYKAADEWQMLVTYEDVLKLNKSDIIDAGYERYDSDSCVYAVYRSPLLGYTRKYYISIEPGSNDFGLVIGAEEYDKDGAPVYSMVAGKSVSDVDPTAFVLPDGTSLLDNG